MGDRADLPALAASLQMEVDDLFPIAFLRSFAYAGIAVVTALDGNSGGPATLTSLQGPQSVKGDGLGIYLNGGVFAGYYNGTGSTFSAPFGFTGIPPKPILGGNIVITPTATSSPCCTT